MQKLRRLAAGIAVMAGALLVAGYGGHWSAALDALALLRVPAAIVLGLSGLLLLGWARLVTLAFAAMGLWSWLGPLALSGPPGTDLRLYQKNLWYLNEDIDDLAADIIASDADVVTLQELSDTNRNILDLLAEHYPHRLGCERGRMLRGEMVLSRLPLAAPADCPRGKLFPALKVESRGGPVWVVSIHLPWPWPVQNQLHVARRAAERMGPFDAPVVIAGDFNTAPWTKAVQVIARAAGEPVVGPFRGTLALDLLTFARNGPHAMGVHDRDWVWSDLRMPIDNVIAHDGSVARRPLLGSDHRGLVADLTIR